MWLRASLPRCPAQPFPVPAFHLETSFIPSSLSWFIPACSRNELAPYVALSISFSRHCVPFHLIATASNDTMFAPSRRSAPPYKFCLESEVRTPLPPGLPLPHPCNLAPPPILLCLEPPRKQNSLPTGLTGPLLLYNSSALAFYDALVAPNHKVSL